MAKRVSIPSKHVKVELVGLRDNYFASRVQRVNATSDQATNTIDELGNPEHAGTSKDVPNVTFTFQVMDVGIDAIAALTGQDAAAFPASGVNLASALDLSVDAVLRVRNATVAQYVKASHLRRCVVQSFTFNYSVDGDSTEEYTAVGSQKRWFSNDVIVEKFTTGGTSFTLSEAPKVLDNGDDVVTAILDGEYLTEVVASPATGEYEVTGVTLTTFDTRNDQLMVVYQSSSTGDAWADIDDDTVPAAIRGKDVVVNIAAADQERVQSVSLNGNFNPQAVREMGNRDTVGYTNQNLEVTGTLTVLDTDTDLLATLTGYDPATDTEFLVGQCTVSGVALEIKLQNPADCDEPFAVLKTVYLPSVSVTSEGFTSNVNDNAQQTFDFRSEDGAVWIYEGARV
jgi:hypothetical protein